jgi:hypothetical protein
VVTDLASNTSTASTRASVASGRDAANNLHLGADLGSSLLSKDARVLELGTIAPNGGLLFPHQGDI